MLKIDRIEFNTADQRHFYKIEGRQIEFFPIIGGEEANIITSKVWNQHGDTFINAFMEPYEGEIIFAVHTRNLSKTQIAESRLKISEFFNPLTGVIIMEVFLNNGDRYKRNINFISAPNFPVGFENRNREFYKVQLQYVANNPFWYSSSEIVNSFQGAEPLFEFPFAIEKLAPVEFGIMKPDNIAFNAGHVEAPVTIKIHGFCQNPTITNKTTGEFIKFEDLAMGANDILEIDTTFGQKKVLLNNENVFNKLDFSSTFFNLQRGENEIDFIDETGSVEAKILFIYNNLFITI